MDKKFIEHDPYGIMARNPRALRDGMNVLYYPTIGTEGPSSSPTPTQIRSEPWQLGDGTWVVKVKGVAGGVACTHLSVSTMELFGGRFYDVYHDEAAPFGDNWCGPNKFQHGQDTLVAVFKAEKDSDGQDCEVYCIAMSARFYAVRTLPGTDSTGDKKSGFVLTTGARGDMA